MRSRPSPAQHAARLALLLLSAVVLAFLTQSLLVKPYLIPSGSMLPTLQIGQRVVVDRLSHRLGSSPHVGDIIVFHPPRGAEAVYCSGMRRAVATATPIAAALGLSPIVVPELHERRIGPLSGRSREDGWDVYQESKRRWVAGDLEFSHPGGESFAEIGRRVLPVLDDLRRRHPGGRLIVVAHGIVIRVALLNLLADRSPADFDAVAIDFASINELVHDGDGWRAEALNVVTAPSPARPVA